jgi:hypothetical protein
VLGVIGCAALAVSLPIASAVSGVAVLAIGAALYPALTRTR